MSPVFLVALIGGAVIGLAIQGTAWLCWERRTYKYHEDWKAFIAYGVLALVGASVWWMAYLMERQP